MHPKASVLRSADVDANKYGIIGDVVQVSVEAVWISSALNIC